MNERIKELAVQAKIQMVSEPRLQEFAELIIKDVMNEVFVVYAGGKKGIDVEFQNITPRQWINHVFGVKEYNTEGKI